MRIYKIIGKEVLSKAKEFYKELEKRRQAYKDLCDDIVPFEFTYTYGASYSFNCLPNYEAFKPNTKLSEVPKGWREFKGAHGLGFYSPDSRTKIGKNFVRELSKIEGFRFTHVDVVLGLPKDYIRRSFTIPRIYKSHDETEFFYSCDDDLALNENDFEEVLLSYANERVSGKTK